MAALAFTLALTIAPVAMVSSASAVPDVRVILIEMSDVPGTSALVISSSGSEMTSAVLIPELIESPSLYGTSGHCVSEKDARTVYDI